MIEILKEKAPKKKKNPYYILRYNYMIGDANGNTTEEVRVSVDNPFVERYVKLLNSLKPTKGHWGIVFEGGIGYGHVEEGHITEDDYDFLQRMMNEEWDEDDFEDGMSPETRFMVDKKDEKFASEFFEGVSGETEYSFLVFKGVELFYYDEYGKKHKTKIKK